MKTFFLILYLFLLPALMAVMWRAIDAGQFGKAAVIAMVLMYIRPTFKYS